MDRMSRPIEDLQPHYQVVVVGSGYGGGIAAARLAKAGRSVCVLERGKELHPGEYPNRLTAAGRHVQAHTKRGHLGSPTALFDFHFGPDISVLVGCGLGGTSLINANVALEAKDWIFDDRWPDELAGTGASELAPYYDRARQMLGSTTYPDDLPRTPKLDALARSAEALGTTAERVPLNVTFRSGPNAAGVMQHACTLCGDCVTGCNYGAKNTVLMNYLPYAHAHGAHIFAEVQVRTIRKRDDGRWLVDFVNHGSGQSRFKGPTQFVTADVVVLAAGSLGSTEILLRSRAAGLPLSNRLGRSFTGNGDVLAFAYDTDTSARAVGLGPRHPTADTSVGPCISGVIDLTDREHPERGLIIQEGSVPGTIAPIVGPVWAASALAFGLDPPERAGIGRRLKQIGGTLLGARRGPTDRTLTYLVMSIDDDTGRLVLEDDRLEIRWPKIGERPIFQYDNAAVAHAAQSIGGTFVPNPMWTTALGRALITVQPLGGCDMGNDATHGVVNHKGQVFAGVKGDAIHDGLYVADGSVVPRPLGANPSLTISALAERIVEKLDEERDWTDGSRRRKRLPTADRTTAGLRFSERMEGFVSTRADDDHDAGYAQGRADGSSMEVVLTIAYEDLHAALRDPEHPARVSGTVLAPELSPRRMTVTGGRFRLLVDEPKYVETWRMRYELEALSEDGRRFDIAGFKRIRKRGSLHAWPDTTTLFVDIKGPDGLRGAGIIRIKAGDFLKQLMSMHAVNVPASERRAHRNAYWRMFARKFLSIYGGPLDEPGRFPIAPAQSIDPASNGGRAADLPDPDVWWCGADRRWHPGIDEGRAVPGVGQDAWLRLIRYRGGDKGPVLLAPGFAMSSTSFIATTTERSIGEFLCANDYDVWLFDYRSGIELPSARSEHTFDDIASEDWPAAVTHVLEVSRAESVQALGHCMGSLSLQMALLAGLQGVRSGVCSQGMVMLAPSALNRFKNAIYVGHVLAGIGIRRVTPGKRPTLANQALDLLLRAVPMPREEHCGQALCRWINLIYGCTHRHAQLNDATHRALIDMFGVGDLTALRHVALMMKNRGAVDRHGQNVYMPHADRMAIPLLLLQGAHNYIFLPKGSERLVQWLRDRNGPGLYERKVLREYAHLDGFIGRDAHRDVFPDILDHLDRYQTVG